MKRINAAVLGLLLFAFCGLNAMAYGDSEQVLRFANIFNNNMVLQQSKPAAVWGWAAPGSKLSVTIEEVEMPQATSGDVPASLVYRDNTPSVFAAVSLQVVAGKDGGWRVSFPAMKASFKAKRITVTDQTGKSVEISNLLIGEVWVCSGQSNMVWSGAMDSDLWNDGLQFHGIRLAKYDFTWPRPLNDLPKKISWNVTSSGLNWPKVSYVFARNLHLKLGVPVGIINNARGGTRGISWTSREELESLSAPVTDRELAEYDAKLKVWESPESLKRLAQAREDVINIWRPRARKAIAAHWKQFEAFMGKNLDEKKYTEWQVIAKEWFDSLDYEDNLPGAIPDWKVWGLERRAMEFFKGTTIKVPEMSRQLWKERPDDKDLRLGQSPPMGLFNAGVAPLKGMAVAGILFYQGENENFIPLDAMEEYRYIFPKIISAHRTVFNDDKLPFGIISLAGWGKYGDVPESGPYSRWSRIMEIHSDTHKATPNTGLITIHDIGHGSIHPPEKQPVGERAARWALATVYGRPIAYKNVYAYKSIAIDKEKVLVTFESDDGTKGDPGTFEGGKDYRGFVVVGKDRRWYAAEVAYNRREQALEVWSDLVKEPVAVRYAWSRFSDGNLGSRVAPVPLFRSDDWPFPESGKKLSGRQIDGLVKKQVQERRIKASLNELEKLTEKADQTVKDKLQNLKKAVMPDDTEKK